MIARILCLALVSAAISAAQAPTFEVVSVKPARTDATGRSFTQRPGGGLSTSNATVRMLIAFAYQVMPEEISGGPPWSASDGFDIEANATHANVTQSQFRQIIQSLLADRFKLTMHRATRELSVYVLVQARNPAKLEDAAADNREASLRIEAPGQITGVKATMPALANVLIRPLKRKVFDETGLTGSYNFQLRFAPELRTGPQTDAPPPGDAPSIFTALQEQLGLSLKTAERPVQVLVIDQVEKPAAN